MTKRPDDLPEFTAPPVSEVVMGIQFGNIPNLMAIHLGILREKFANDFPNYAEVPPLQPVFEVPGTPPGNSISIALQSGPELPRIWMISADDAHLVQFQTDRLLQNWRKRPDAGEYPRYEEIRAGLIESFSRLQSFIDEQKMTLPPINQCEIMYVNTIESIDGQRIETKPGASVKFWSDDELAQGDMELEDARFLLRYVLKEGEGKPMGRLLVELLPAIGTGGRQQLQLRLTARGAPKEATMEGVLDFCDKGRELIVRKFAELTTVEMHERWGRTK